MMDQRVLLETIRKRNRHHPSAMGMDIAMLSCAKESVEYGGLHFKKYTFFGKNILIPHQTQQTSAVEPNEQTGYPIQHSHNVKMECSTHIRPNCGHLSSETTERAKSCYSHVHISSPNHFATISFIVTRNLNKPQTSHNLTQSH